MSTTEIAEARISPAVFFGIQWFLVAVTLLLLVFRLFIRISAYRRIYAEDICVIAAWSMFLASSILWHFHLAVVYPLYQFELGQYVPTSSFLDETLSLLRATTAFMVLFYCCLWSVKLSFLLFFWRLGERMNIKLVRIWWWIVLLVTIAGLGFSLGFGQYNCSIGDPLYLISYCGTADAREVQARDTRIATSMDILTDGLIITIPVIMLWKTRLPTSKKFGLMGIFSLSILTMIFALIRIVVLPGQNIAIDLSWSYMWSNIELGVAIMAACLGAFRQLYVNRQSQTKDRTRSSWSWLRRLRSAVSDSATPNNYESMDLSFHGGHQARQNTAVKQTSDGTTLNNSSNGGGDSGEKAQIPSAWGMDRTVFIDESRNDTSVDIRDSSNEFFTDGRTLKV